MALDDGNQPSGPVAWIMDQADLGWLAEALRSSSEVVFDLETTGLDEYAVARGPWNGGVAARVVLLALTLPQRGEDGSWDGIEPGTWLVPLSHPESPWQGRWRAVLRALMKIVVTEHLPTIGHNLRFDCRWVASTTGLDLAETMAWDTAIGEHLLDENVTRRLKDSASRRFGIENWADFDLSYPGAAEDVPLFELGAYAARDTWWTWKLERAQREAMYLDAAEGEAEVAEPIGPEEMQDARLGQVATWVSMPTMANLTKVEQRGMLVDVPWVKEHLAEDEEAVRVDLDAMASRYGQERASASSAPTSKWFIEFTQRALDARELRVGAITEGGSPQWSKSVLTRQAHSGSEVASLILDVRKHAKRAEYLRSWLGFEHFGVIRAHYNDGSIVTGRLSSDSPNMQQCFKGDVETLTPNGWVRLDELSDDDFVMQSDEAGNARFVRPSQVVRQPFSGNGVRMKADWIDAWMTGDHRVLSYTRGGRPIWESASEWLGRGASSGIIDRAFRRAVNAEGVVKADRELLRLALAVQADGISQSAVSWVIKVYKDRKREALRAMGGVDISRSGRSFTQLQVLKSDLRGWLTPGKDLRMDRVLLLGSDDLAWLVDEAMQWDGDSTRGATFKQAERHRASVDVIQVAAALSGRSTTRYEHAVAGGLYPVVNVHRNALRHASRMSVTSEAFEGTVYCVTVPSGAFVVRIGGTVLVTGNCTSALKPAFVPREGYVMAEIDYSQIEMRVAAFVSRCQPMIEAFQRGDDLHRLLAARIAGVAPAEVTSLQRQRAKAGNFGLLFGMGPEGFRIYAETAYDVILTMEQAAATHAAFFDMWEGMASWHAKQVGRAKREGAVTSPLGRVRRLPDIWSGNSYLSSHAERQAINSPVQGFASDLMQMASASIQGLLPGSRAIKGVHVVGTVHDSIVVEALASDWRALVSACIDRMTTDVLRVLRSRLGVAFDVPLAAEASVGTRWGLHDLSDAETTSSSQLSVVA